MIPKPLDQIEWADLEELKASGREESDTIEYKASFSGGSDFLGFNEAQRDKAIRGVARETIAFLNGRGGDVIIGAEEEGNENARIKELKLISSVSSVADRLAQSLAAVIEPYQSIVGVRAIRHGTEDVGVIVVRAPQSLRAPHRLTKNKECYIRRGKESVPMPMDEIQDLTVRRTDLRRERLEVLDSQMQELTSETVGRSKLNLHRFHARLIYLPFNSDEIVIDDTLKSALRGSDPVLQLGNKTKQNDVAFRDLGTSWRPILRGARIEQLTERAWHADQDFMYCAKSVKRDGFLSSDFACLATLGDSGQSATGFHFDWVVGFLANSLQSFINVVIQRPAMQGGILRLCVACAGSISMRYGDQMWGSKAEFPVGTMSIPDYEASDVISIKSAFELFQSDIAAIAGLEFPSHYSFSTQ